MVKFVVGSLVSKYLSASKTGVAPRALPRGPRTRVLGGSLSLVNLLQLGNMFCCQNVVYRSISAKPDDCTDDGAGETGARDARPEEKGSGSGQEGNEEAEAEGEEGEAGPGAAEGEEGSMAGRGGKTRDTARC